MFRLVFTMLLVAFAVSLAGAQNVDEKVFQRKSLKSIQKSISKFRDDNYIPVDLSVSTKGRKNMFSARMVKRQQPFEWFAEFDLDDVQFNKLNDEYQQKKCFLVAHELYTSRKENRHACIWHFDNNRNFHSRDVTDASKDKPAAIPLGTVWNGRIQIPVDGKGHPVCNEIEKKALNFIRSNDMPAMSVAIMFGPELVFQKAYGFADFQLKRKLAVDHAFRLGGICDLITCVAAVQLVDRGKLNIDQPVFEIIDAKPWKPKLQDAQMANITVRNLLQNTSGFDPNSGGEPGYMSGKIKKEMKLSDQPTPQQLIEYGISRKLAFPPGADQKESRFGMFLLARVIEKASGQSYSQYVLSEIAKPLAMDSLRMTPTNPDLNNPGDVVHIHRKGEYFRQLIGNRAGSWVQHNHGAIDFRLLDASDGWRATPLDVLKLINAIDPAGDNSVLSQRGKVILFARNELTTAAGGPGKWNAMGVEVQPVASRGLRFGRRFDVMGASGGFNSFPGGIRYCYLFNTSSTIANESPSKFEKTMYEECFRVKNSFTKKNR